MEKRDLSDPSTSLKSSDFEEEGEKRDEIEEIRKATQKDNSRIRFWRIALATAIVATATLVTYITFSNLLKEQKTNFETAVCDRQSGMLAQSLLSSLYVFSILERF